MTTLGHQLGTADLQSFQVVTEGTPRDLNAICFEEIYQIAKEALSNVLRHSGAANSSVNLQFDARHLTVRVFDDGRGIAPEQQNGSGHARHWGIQGMRERAAKLNGEFKIASSPAIGTEVSLQVPASVAYSIGVRDRIVLKFYRRWVLRQNNERASERPN